jgi:formate hydrogenlyase transcriptional activator
VRELRNVIESPDAQQQLRKLAEVEREYIIATLERLSWKVRGKDGAAIALGLPPTILESRMKKTGNSASGATGVNSSI